MASQVQVRGYLVDDKGTWTVKARFADILGGKAKLHSRSTGIKVKGNNKRRAEAAMREIVAEWEEQANRAAPTVNPLFGECVEQWLERKALTVRPNTLAGYRVAANAHIIPELGEIGICDLIRQHLQRYFEKLQRDSISACTMKKHRVIIRGTLKDAVLDGLISANVADQVSLPKGQRFEGSALSEGQVAELLDELEKQPEPVRVMVTLAVVYALRRSEICGLRWQDIDFDNGVIHIRNTVTEYGGTVYEVEDTKTKTSCRDLHLIPETVVYLKGLLQSQHQNGSYSGKVCVHLDGRAVKPPYCTRACMRFLKRCGYDGTRLHDLRATAATILAKRGVPIKNVQDYLGHKDLQTTVNYYVHLLDEDKIATANVMGSFLAGAGFSSECSEKCSESRNSLPDNVIPIDAIASKKCIEK